jgi:hypothetical protein
MRIATIVHSGLRRVRPVVSAFAICLPLFSGSFLPSATAQRDALPPQRPDPIPAPENAVAVVKVERGFIDDAFALSSDGSLLYYVNTDGANWAKLRAVGLTPRPAAANPAPAATPAQNAPHGNYPPLRPADAKAPGAGTGAGKTPAAPPAQQPAAPAEAKAPAPPAVVLAPGASADVLTNISLSTTKVLMLPDDRVLSISRDLETGGTVNGAVYSLRSRAAVPVPGASGGVIGPVTDITLGDSPGGPVIVAMTRAEGRVEHQIQVYSAITLKSLGQRTYRGSDADGRIKTAQGSGNLLYFVDDYQTLVVKHDGFYDKKKDVRQPDFLAFVDALTGKVRRSQNIIDPPAVLELSRLHKEHGESVFPLYDTETQKLELIALSDAPLTDPNVQAETRVELTLARPTGHYEAASLHAARLRRDRVLFSLTIDPVNEKAVAEHRTDPDDISFYVVDPTAGRAAPGTLRHLRTLPGHKRPSLWSASQNGRVALLRKYKNYPRGGTAVEVYDLDIQ